MVVVVVMVGFRVEITGREVAATAAEEEEEEEEE